MKLHTAYGILAAVAVCAAEGGAAPNPAMGLTSASSSLVTRQQSDEVLKQLNQIAVLTKQKRDETDVDFAKRAETDLGNLIVAILNSGWVGQVVDTISQDPDLKGVITNIAKGIVDTVVTNLWPLLKAIWNSGLIGKTIQTFLNDKQVMSALFAIIGDIVKSLFSVIVGFFSGGSSSSGSGSNGANTATPSTAPVPAPNPGATTTTVRAPPPTDGAANGSATTGGNFLDNLFGGGGSATTKTTSAPIGTTTGGNFLDGLFGGGASHTTSTGDLVSYTTGNPPPAGTGNNNVLNSLYGAYGNGGAGGDIAATGSVTVAVSAGDNGAQLSVAAPDVTAAATVDSGDSPAVTNNDAVYNSLAAAYGQHKRDDVEYLSEREVQQNVDAVVAQLKQSGLVEQFLKKLTSDPNQASDFLSQVLAKSIVSLDELYSWAKDNGLVDSMLSALQSSGNEYAKSLGDYLQKNGGSLEGAIAQLSQQIGGSSNSGSSGNSASASSAAPAAAGAPAAAPAAANAAATTAAPAAAATTSAQGVVGGINAIFESLQAAYGNKPAATTLYQKRMLY